jgi:hypothetical protein
MIKIHEMPYPLDSDFVLFLEVCPELLWIIQLPFTETRQNEKFCLQTEVVVVDGVLFQPWILILSSLLKLLLGILEPVVKAIIDQESGKADS